MESLRRLTSSVFEAAPGSRLRRGSVSDAAADARALGLTLISGRLLVSGLPVDAPTDKQLNRVNADELAQFLEAHHRQQFLLFNLNALEETATAGSSDRSRNIANKLHDQVLEFAWERDGMKAHTPPLELVFRICYAIFAWLSLDAGHVAIVNCQTGKTRSGVVVACYLLFARLADDPVDAFVEFYRRRWEMKALTPQALRSKTPPSIQRFLASFHELVEQQKPPNDKPLLLKAIMFRQLPVELQPCVQIWDDYKLIFCTDAVHTGGGGGAGDTPVLEWNEDDGFFAILWENGVELDGGFSILCSFGEAYTAEDMDASSRVLFRYADSTWFLLPGMVTLKKNQLDLMKQYEHGFDDELFSMDLVLHDNSAKQRRPAVRIDYTGNNAVRQGLIEITKHHMVLPDPAMHSNFIRMGFSETPTTFALQRSQNTPNVALDVLHMASVSSCFSRERPESPETRLEGKEAALTAPDPLETASNRPPLLRRHTTAQIVAMQSQRSKYAAPTVPDASLCCVCKEDDYMMRPQVVQCAGQCRQRYHTTCVGLRKIPFGLTTISDRTNHSVYVKKFFSSWECDACASASAVAEAALSVGGQVPENMTLVPSAWVAGGLMKPAAAAAVDRSANPQDVPAVLTVATAMSSAFGDHSEANSTTKETEKLDQLRAFLASSGVSVDDLLRAATTRDVALPSLVEKSAVKSEVADGGSGSSRAQGVGDSIQSIVKVQATEERAVQDVAPTPSSSDQSMDKYERMLKRGVPFEAVQNCMVKDGRDPSVLQPLPPPEPDESDRSDAPPSTVTRLKDVEEFRPYFSMLRLGCPREAVLQKLAMDGVDPLILELGPDASYEDVKHQIAPSLRQSKLQDDIKSVKPPRVDANSALASGSPLATNDDKEVRLGHHEVYGKYFKMLKMGLPEDAVRHKMKKDGADERALDLGGDALFSVFIVQSGGVSSDEKVSVTEVKLKDHEVYGKYFKMLEMGLPEGAVRHKVVMDGGNVRALVLGPEAPVSALTPASGASESAKAPAKTLRGRKKLHWQPISEDRLSSLNQQTIWEDKEEEMAELQMDMDELESLFFANKDGGAKKTAGRVGKPLKRKQSVTLIDGKRAMNAAISLARVKLSYQAIALAIEGFDPSGLTVQQLMGINEFLPTAEEVATVTSYNGDSTLLGEAEKFIVSIAKVKRYASRTECLIFKLSFASRSAELHTSLANVRGACEEVKGSRLLKLLLGTVLKLGNTLNGSGEANGIRGFTVDSLLRLGHTKAVNHKTTVLHYLVRLVKKNLPQVLDFQNELRSVPLAARESLDGVADDFTRLQSGLSRLEGEIALLDKEAVVSGSVLAAMRSSAEEIKARLAEVEDEVKRGREEVASVLDYFGEDPKRSPGDFFTTLTSFCSAFEGARKEVDAEDEAALRAERVQQRRLTASKSPASSDTQGRAEVGALFRRQQRDRVSSDRSLGSTQSLMD